VLRYGGYGDVLVAGSTFPHLKAEGWHLTVYTGDKGREVLRHDPHVDRVVSHDVLELRKRRARAS
jgi:ADP-heptose:LPS heptosyltransferase